MTQKTIYFKEPNTTIGKTSSNVHDLLFQEDGLQVGAIDCECRTNVFGVCAYYTIGTSFFGLLTWAKEAPNETVDG